jgi:hypothetical protein
MKTKLRDKLVSVQVLVGLLVYSLDKLTTKDAFEGDVIEIPHWMVEGLVKEGRVTTDVPEVDEPEEPAKSDEGDKDDGGEGPMTVAELKALTDVDFAVMQSTDELAKWAAEQEPLSELTIHPACKRETSMDKIFAAIELLED